MAEELVGMAEGLALVEKAAGQGHVWAMYALGAVHAEKKEHDRALEWFTKAAEAGLPTAMYAVGSTLAGMEPGAAAPDYPAAAGWYRRAADAGCGQAAKNLSRMYLLGRGWAWQTMPASSSPHLCLSFLEFSGIR